MPAKYTPEERLVKFWARVDKSGGDDACWIWTGAITTSGYGQCSWQGIPKLSHRASWEIHYGDIPDGLWVLHDCPDGDNRACVNPAHLWLGTHQDNMKDMKQKGRAAIGARHVSQLHPERLARGSRHGTKTHPGCIPHGDRHWSHLSPERIARGENNAASKLTELGVMQMRQRHATGSVSMKRLALEFNVSISTVYRTVRGQTWKHIIKQEVEEQ